MKVNLMVIGAMKCGTTTLSEILRGHPEIDFRSREMNFFSKTENWKRDIGKYEKSFRLENKKIYGEASTHYTYYPEFNLGIWRDIFAYNPAMKFIYVVRDPVERAVSQYMHMFERGYTDLSLEEAIRKEPTIINNGRFYTQIKPYIDMFGRDQVLVLDFDDLMKRRSEVLGVVAGFLEINPDKFSAFDDVHANVTLGGGKWHHKYDTLKSKLNPLRKFFPKKARNYLWDLVSGRNKRAFRKKPEISPDFREVIIQLSYLDIKGLEGLTGKDYSHWLKANK